MTQTEDTILEKLVTISGTGWHYAGPAIGVAVPNLANQSSLSCAVAHPVTHEKARRRNRDRGRSRNSGDKFDGDLDLDTDPDSDPDIPDCRRDSP